jgi:hypothetical protein
MLERALAEDVVKNKSAQGAGSSDRPTLPEDYDDEGDSDSEYDIPEDERNLEPNNLISEDPAYYDDVDDDLVDLGVQLGRMRITDRIGGLVRPRFAEELAQGLKEIRTSMNQHYPGSLMGQHPKAYLAPGRDYLPPSSGFMFAPKPQKANLVEFLPTKPVVDMLLDHYWKAVHVICRTLHRPTFERQLDAFWRDISIGAEPRVSFQAVILATLLSAAISFPEDRVLTECGVSKETLVDNFKQGTEAALSRANFLRTTKIETIQAFVMYLIPLCRGEVSRAHSALVGTVIRLAECMGMHRDPSIFQLSPVEVFIRRLIWHQICFLDIRTCEATGPRPQIRSDDFDTKFPLNVNDEDLEHGLDPKEDSKSFTDMTIARIRFECNEMLRHIWHTRPRVAKKKTTLTALLTSIQRFQQKMEQIYLPMLDRRVPLHFLASQFYGIYSARFYVSVLNFYATNSTRLMPERLRDIMVGSCVRIIEHSMTIESTPALSLWTWYLGAIHQYHCAILLLTELHVQPKEKEFRVRAWRCLDYAFQLPPELHNMDKARIIISELANRFEAYTSLRRMRAPISMRHPGPRVLSHQFQLREAEERERRSASAASGASSASGLAPPDHLEKYTPSTSLENTNPQIPIPQMTFPLSEHAFNPTPVISPENEDDAFLFSQDPRLTPIYGDNKNTNPPTMTATDLGGAHSSGGASGSSPGDPMGLGTSLPEIDWNEWDKLFPPAEMQVSNDIVVPPFTFPQFSPADLEWAPDRM